MMTTEQVRTIGIARSCGRCSASVGRRGLPGLGAALLAGIIGLSLGASTAHAQPAIDVVGDFLSVTGTNNGEEIEVTFQFIPIGGIGTYPPATPGDPVNVPDTLTLAYAVLIDGFHYLRAAAVTYDNPAGPPGLGCSGAAPAGCVEIGGATAEEAQANLELVSLENPKPVCVRGRGGDDYIHLDNLPTEGGGGGGGEFSCMGKAQFDTFIDGGDGDDVLVGSGGNDWLLGGDGNDLLLGLDGDDGDDGYPCDGGNGDDIVEGGLGNDVLRGGPGRDILRGGRGGDNLSGGEDYDLLDYRTDGGPRGVTVDMPAGTATDSHGDTDALFDNFEVIRGTAEADTITGSTRRGMTIIGGAGNDTLAGGAADQADIIYGQDGNDTIIGDNGSDILIGGSGNDTIYGGRLTGGEDVRADEIYGDGDPVPPFIRTKPHYINGDPARPSNFDVLDDSPVGATAPGPGLIEIRQALRGYTADEGTAAPMSGNFLLPCNDDGSVTGLDGEVVGVGNDTIYGDRGADRIAGGGGNDTIYGGEDDDLIFGDRVHDRATAVAEEGDWGPWPATAADILSDRFGNDRIRGQLGADTIIGGGGADRIMGDEDPRVSGGGGADIIYGDYFFLTQADYDLIVANVAVPMGGLHADTIYGGAQRDRIFGGPGDDTIIGGPATPFAMSIAGATVWQRGDLMQGNQGDDLIIGGELDPVNPLSVADDGFSVGTPMKIDLNPGDVADYSRVPAASATSSGIFVNLVAGTTPLGPSGLSGTSSGDGELLPLPLLRNGVDTLIGIENVIGSVNDDVIIGADPPSTPSNIDREWNQYTRNAFGDLAFPLGNSPSTYVMANYPWGFHNILVGNDGNDLIVGRRGDDALWGGDGDDVLWGDNRDEGDGTGTGPGSGYDDPETMGNDQLWGGAGNDEIHGEYGQDILRGGDGEDFISGGAGRDVLDYTESGTGVLVNLGESDQDVSAGPAALADLVFALDQLVNPAAARKFDLTAMLPLPGGTYRYPDHENNPLDNQPCAPGNILCAGTAYGENRDMDTISNNVGLQIGARIYRDQIEVVLGQPGATDVIYGKPFLPNELHGLGGNDMLFGGDADDRLYGGAGSDLLDGRGGNDHLIGTDWETIPPGERLESDSDWVSYASVTNPADGIGGTRGVVVNLGGTEPQDTRAAGIDRLTQIENVIGTAFDDVIKGNEKANILYGGDGDDWLVGRSDADIIQHNVVHIRHDLLHGGPGTDVADYRMSDPAAIRSSLAILEAISNPPACFSDPAVHCFIEDDGETEAGSDWLVQIEAWREPGSNLRPQITVMGTTDPARPHVVQDDGSVVIAPGARLTLRASATGGQPPYRAEVTPTTDKTVPTELDPRVRTVPIVVPATATNLAFNAPFQFEVRPLKTTTFRVSFTDLQDSSDLGQDGESPPPATASVFRKVIVAPVLGVTIDRKQYTIRAGESTQLQATITGGQTPITILWTLDNGGAATGLTPTNVLKPTASPTATTRYLITVRDAVGQVAEARTTVEVLAEGSSAHMLPETGVSTGSGGGNSGAGNSSTTSQSLGEPESGQPTVFPAPCGSGAGGGFMVMNLLLLAGMRRRMTG